MKRDFKINKNSSTLIRTPVNEYFISIVFVVLCVFSSAILKPAWATEPVGPIEDQIRMLLEESLAEFDLADLIPSPAGEEIDFSTNGTYDIYIDNVGWASLNITVQSADSGFEVTITYSAFVGDILCSKTCTWSILDPLNCVGPGEITGVLEIERIVFTLDLFDDDCHLEIDPISISTSANNVSVVVDAVFAPFIEPWIDNFIDDFKADFESAMVDIVNTVIGEISPALSKGDFEPDGDVDGSDLYVFTADFGRTNCNQGQTCEGDFDGDNDVDEDDMAVFAMGFGRADCL